MGKLFKSILNQIVKKNFSHKKNKKREEITIPYAENFSQNFKISTILALDKKITFLLILYLQPKQKFIFLSFEFFYTEKKSVLVCVSCTIQNNVI